MLSDRSGWQVRLDPAEIAGRRAAGEWRNRTIVDDARDRAARDPDRACVRSGDDILTFGSALAQAERLAAGLWRLGLRPGDVVSFQLPNWLEAVPINLAAALIGLVVNPVVPIYRQAEVALILRDCRAKAVFITDLHRGFDYAAMYRSLAPELPDLAHVIGVRGACGSGRLAFEDLVREDASGMSWPPRQPESVKLVMYTSGTTGRPKGVLHTHETLPRSIQSCMDNWRLDADDVVLMPSPITHITGYGWGLEAPFYHGLEAVLMERWEPDEAVRLVERHGATMTVGATPFLAELVAAAERAGSRLPSIRVFACGGAAVPPGLVRHANALFERGRACRVYGSTEAPMITLGFVGEGTADLAAMTDGAIRDYDVELVDDDGCTVETGREGEVLARGPALFVGYADPAETATSFTPDGRFRMGDLGYMTEDGAVVITGRKKDLIIRGGENISAKEIEDALHQHPAIREAAVVSMPHERLIETVCAFIIADGVPPSLREVDAHLARLGLARQKTPEHLEVVDSLPRTASGKIKKDTLRARIADHVAQRRSPVSATTYGHD